MALALKKKTKPDGGASAPPRPPSSGRGGGAASKGKGGKKRFVLLVGDEGAILIFMQGAKVVRRLFAPSAQPSHSEAMVEIMRSNPNVPLVMLLDVIDQQYVPHSFPPVSALSVGGLVKRRLDRDFQPEDLKGSLQIGRDKTGRKEWKYLLISLAKTPLLAEWLDLMLELPNEMKGLYLVPVEAANYVAMLNKKITNEKPRAWQLLISHNKVSGFRQVVLQNGKLIFTRVSQAIDDAIPAVIAGNVEQEIINTMEYLKRLELHDSTELDATVIVSQDVSESIDLRRFNFGRATVLNPLAVSEALGLEQAALSADRFGDVVLGAAFGISKKHNLRFSNAYIEKLKKIYMARIGLRATAALASLALLVMAGLSMMSAIENSAAATQSASKQSAMQPELEKMKKSVDGLDKYVAFKSAIVSSYDAYIAGVPRVAETVMDIARFTSAQQRVIAVMWDANAPAQSTPAAPASAEKLPLEVKLSIDFSGSGNTVEAVSAAAEKLLDSMKSGLARYEVSKGEFPWEAGDNQNVTVSLDNTSAQSTALKDSVGTIVLRGVKKAAPAPASAAPAPATSGVTP